MTSEHEPSPVASRAGARHDAGDGRFFLLAGLAILVLVNLPVVYGYLHPAPPGTRFVGTLDRFPGDMFYHLSFATQVARGKLLLEDKYNANQVRTQAFPNAIFLSIGLAQRAGLSAEAAYHLLRNLTALLLLAGIWCLCGAAIRGRFWRRTAFLLASLGAGFGWLPYLAGLVQYPNSASDISAWYDAAVSQNPFFAWFLDGWLLELSPYWLMETEFVAPAVMCLTLVFWAQVVRRDTWQKAGRLTMVALLPAGIALTHPHDVVNLAATLSLLLLWGAASRPRPPWVRWRVLWLALPALPFYAWFAWLLVKDPVLREYASLSDPNSPVGLLGGLGLPAIVLLWRARSLLSRDWPRRMAVVASVTRILLFALPFAITRQYYNLHCLSIFVAVGAVAGLERLSERVERRRGARRVAWLMLALCPWTNVAIVAVQLTRLQNPDSSFYVSKDLVRVLAWARWMLPDQAVLLASPTVSRQVPYRVGCRVVLAQTEQTAHYYRVKTRFDRFVERLRTSPDTSWLDEVGVTHLLVDPLLRRRLGKGLDRLFRLGHLRPLYGAGEFQLFRYQPAGGPVGRPEPLTRSDQPSRADSGFTAQAR